MRGKPPAPRPSSSSILFRLPLVAGLSGRSRSTPRKALSVRRGFHKRTPVQLPSDVEYATVSVNRTKKHRSQNHSVSLFTNFAPGRKARKQEPPDDRFSGKQSQAADSEGVHSYAERVENAAMRRRSSDHQAKIKRFSSSHAFFHATKPRFPRRDADGWRDSLRSGAGYRHHCPCLRRKYHR